MGLFYLKGALFQPKTLARVSSCDTKRPWRGLGGKWLLVSSSAQKKFCKIHSSKPEGWNFKFYEIVLSKRYVVSAKNCGRSFILWHWRAMDSLEENLLLVSNSTQKKLGEFPSSRREGQNIKFQQLVLSNDKFLEQKIDTAVSSPDTEGPWKVWWKSDSWFPIKPRK